MRRNIAIALCVFAPGLCMAQAPKSAPVSMAGATALSITNTLGYVRVEGWDVDSVAIAAGSSDGLVVRRDATGEIRINPPRDAGGGNIARADILVRVPRNIRVSLDGHQTKFDVSGLTGRVDISDQVEGDIKVTGTPSELNIGAGGSDLDLQVTTPYLRAQTGSGRIRWTGSSDDVFLSTIVNGIMIQAGSVGRGRFESTSGDIHFRGGVTKRASITFESHSGDITADFAKGTEAEVIVTGAVVDLFGQHVVGPTDPAKLGSEEKQIGSSHDAVVTLRSFKGRVSTTLLP